MTTTARLTEDGAHFRLASGLWSGVYPVDQLAAQIAFYTGLRDRKGGRYAAFYEGTVAALEALARDLGVPSRSEGGDPRPVTPFTVSPPSRPAGHTAGHGTSQLSFGL